MADYVLITGVSTGIGNGIAGALIKRGTHVFGSVRKEEDANRCQEQFGELFTPLLFDVTDSPAIEAAVVQVKEMLGSSSLTGLVNNAGYAVNMPLKEVPLENVRQQFEVNVLGVLDVIQRFLPMLGAS